MAEHVLTVLRAKRLEIAAQVHDTEKKLAKMRAALANLDAAMGILSPDHPDYLPDRRRRSRYFAVNELARLVREALRDASKPLTAAEVAAAIMAAKGLTPAHHLAVTKMVIARLGAFATTGAVTKLGKTKGARWAVSPGGERHLL
ncbi:MAG: hypothetical protein ACREHF_09455 [Rhizomicrobium sp.]